MYSFSHTSLQKVVIHVFSHVLMYHTECWQAGHLIIWGLLYFLSFLNNELDAVSKCEVLATFLRHQGLFLKLQGDLAIHLYPKGGKWSNYLEILGKLLTCLNYLDISKIQFQQTLRYCLIASNIAYCLQEVRHHLGISLCYTGYYCCNGICYNQI